MTCDEIRDLAPAYVLGALERDEERSVLDHLATCPHPHEEMTQLGGVVPYLDETVVLVEPPAALRARILSAAADDLAAGRVLKATPAPAMPTVAGTRATRAVVPLGAAWGRPRDLRMWALGLAAVFAIVALGAWNVVTQQELADARAYQARLAAAIVQAGQPGSQVAVLTGTGGPGTGAGGIAVMPSSGGGTLLVSGLAPTAGSQVYEAWAIVDGQPPAPVAGFTVGRDGIGYSDRMPSATGQTMTIAITLEPKPNPTAPSSAPIAAGVAVSPKAGS